EAGYPEPPRTWTAWTDAMTRVKERGGGERYAILLPLREWQPPIILALQRGGSLLRDGDRYGNFESGPVRAAFDFYLDLFRRGLAPRAGDTEVTNVYQDFARGGGSPGDGRAARPPDGVGRRGTREPASCAGFLDSVAIGPLDTQDPGMGADCGQDLAVFGGGGPRRHDTRPSAGRPRPRRG